jgi:hypothetical protein
VALRGARRGVAGQHGDAQDAGPVPFVPAEPVIERAVLEHEDEDALDFSPNVPAIFPPHTVSRDRRRTPALTLAEALE